MTQLNININMEELTESVLNSNINSMMKSMAVLVFNAYMEAERDEHIRASQYERTISRTDYRNGYYERDFTLSIGRLTLKVPRTRNGDFSTKLFKRYNRMDQAFVLSMVEAVINGGGCDQRCFHEKSVENRGAIVRRNRIEIICLQRDEASGSRA